MQCPIDSHSLDARKINNLEINACSVCDGIWFDEGEFRTVMRDIVHFNFPEKHQLSLQKDKEKHNSSNDPKSLLYLHVRNLSCPKDGGKLETLNYDPPSQIYLDRCGTCSGIWLDGDEVALVKKDLAPNLTMDALVRAFSENEREDEEERKEFASLPFLSYLLFAPAFLIPFKTEEDTSGDKQFLPVGVTSIVILFVAVFVPQNSITKQELSIMATILLALWIFGRSIEGRFTTVGYLLLFFFGSISGSIISWFAGGSPEAQTIISATSGVSAIMGAYLVLFPKRKLTLSLRGASISIPAWWYIITWLVFQYFFYSYDIHWNPSDYSDGETLFPIFGQSFLSHIASFGIGLVAGLFLVEKKTEQLSPPSK